MRALIGIILALCAAPLAAHEFWLEPEGYRVAPGASISARAINGENFEGVEYSYSDAAYSRSGVISPAGRAKLRGEAGQRPAVSVPGAAEGLNVIFHASPVNKLIYPGMEKFEKFLRGKKLEAALEIHRAKGFAEEKIGESYIRFAKALVAVGGGAGADAPIGLPYELVALSNPYTDGGPVRFSLLLDGKPAARAPVFVFIKQSGAVRKIWLETNGDGQFEVPREAGAFMVNAVRIIESNGKLKERFKTDWTTLWASLVYAIE